MPSKAIVMSLYDLYMFPYISQEYLKLIVFVCFVLYVFVFCFAFLYCFCSAVRMNGVWGAGSVSGKNKHKQTNKQTKMYTKKDTHIQKHMMLVDLHYNYFMAAGMVLGVSLLTNCIQCFKCHYERIENGRVTSLTASRNPVVPQLPYE